MPFNINDIRASMSLDGARPTLFMVEIQNPYNGLAGLKIPISVRAASIPARTFGQIPVPYFGRTINLRGDPQYDAWSVGILNDEDFVIREAFEQWCDAINAPEDNVARDPGLAYKSSAIVTQFSKTGETIRRYRFDGIFPVQVGDINLNWGAQNQVEEFGVTFAVDKWVSLPSVTSIGSQG